MDHIDNDFNPGNGDDYNVGNDDDVVDDTDCVDHNVGNYDDDVVDDTDCVERDFETSRTAVEDIVPIQFTASHLFIIIVIINTNPHCPIFFDGLFKKRITGFESPPSVGC